MLLNAWFEGGDQIFTVPKIIFQPDAFTIQEPGNIFCPVLTWPPGKYRIRLYLDFRRKQDKNIIFIV
jgi:hypothetical protein